MPLPCRFGPSEELLEKIKAASGVEGGSGEGREKSWGAKFPRSWSIETLPSKSPSSVALEEKASQVHLRSPIKKKEKRRPFLVFCSATNMESRRGDCKDKQDAQIDNCTGNPDQYGNHRSPRIVSLKHHWWWMMTTVWDGLVETRRHQGHILFIEEDHYIFPNAYRNIQILTDLKQSKCPDCYAANLAPSDVKAKGEGWESLVAEKIGNVGYTFNRTVWRKIHAKAFEFCSFDDYNWDITMWAAVYPSWGSHVYTLRGPRRSAAHFGKCGLHQGQEEDRSCIDNGKLDITVEDADKHPNIKTEWGLHVFEQQGGYQAGFRGWGGWGDKRDQQLCMSFASMYHVVDSSHEARSLKHKAMRQPTSEMSS
ncbi:alpha-1,6-mannosyl-glycoprotein 2-beta-N-acetylglucosaminyltransferase isoform X2 [Nymphaea colorata]|uniref:alpha-1,6-mannosyl-glycoprotein 2-beta-N-acetylglucosaminyltransferase isoform X2 n=1 Tax=Nymphaea colorata TaxID=210225 RepID=UPI00129D6507|nr:alpha-1,6-mannosyl-glycoprotein 2-beta-N-acetylglucosaminyltransferase isoform X2 [Nymphaea colorata]